MCQLAGRHAYRTNRWYRPTKRCRAFATGDCMSEPDSLYLRVRLSKEAYRRYLDSVCADARDFADWMDWIGKAKMYGEGITQSDIGEIGQRSSKRKTSEEIDAWASDAWNIGKSEYDEATETWRF